ncbi:hypothetical protein [Phaeobacter sp. JH20_13]|uniref:hypothetical protein n=1 Tax=Phaeobacter sp. JH20_13 TaxID=3112472 RepID=UPI003A885F59
MILRNNPNYLTYALQVKDTASFNAIRNTLAAPSTQGGETSDERPAGNEHNLILIKDTLPERPYTEHLARDLNSQKSPKAEKTEYC